MTGGEAKEFPPRLFASGQYPKGRLNVYSKPDILSFVQTTLGGSLEWKIITESPFGALYNLHVSQCPISCQLIHILLSRQLVINKELWTIFGGIHCGFPYLTILSLTVLLGFVSMYAFLKRSKQDT